MSNSIITCMSNNLVNEKLKSNIDSAVRLETVQKTLSLIGLTLKGNDLYELSTGEPLKYKDFGWVRDNGDKIKYSCWGYDTSDNSIITVTEMNVSRGEKSPLEIKIFWEDGEPTSLECSARCDDLDAIPQLRGKGFGLKSVSTSYKVDSWGYQATITGSTPEGISFDKHVSTGVEGITMLYELSTDGEGPFQGQSLFFQESDGAVEFDDENDKVIRIPVTNARETALYLFNRMSNDERTKEAKEFVLDCASSEAPGLRDLIDRLSAQQNIILEATNLYTFDFPNKDAIDSAIEKTENPRFDSRKDVKGKNKARIMPR